MKWKKRKIEIFQQSRLNFFTSYALLNSLGYRFCCSNIKLTSLKPQTLNWRFMSCSRSSSCISDSIISRQTIKTMKRKLLADDSMYVGVFVCECCQRGPSLTWRELLFLMSLNSIRFTLTSEHIDVIIIAH